MKIILAATMGLLIAGHEGNFSRYAHPPVPPAIEKPAPSVKQSVKRKRPVKKAPSAPPKQVAEKPKKKQQASPLVLGTEQNGAHATVVCNAEGICLDDKGVFTVKED